MYGHLRACVWDKKIGPYKFKMQIFLFMIFDKIIFDTNAADVLHWNDVLVNWKNNPNLVSYNTA